MNVKEAYFKIKVPSCYHKSGSVYLDKIPSFAQTRAQRDAEKSRELSPT